ncbi:hypothetical protein RDABS01_039290 [Bienertia sinuspersici]
MVREREKERAHCLSHSHQNQPASEVPPSSNTKDYTKNSTTSPPNQNHHSASNPPPPPPPPSSVSPSFKSILETPKNPTLSSSIPSIPPINPPPPPPPGFNPNTETFPPIDLSSLPEVHSEWKNSIFLKVLGHSFSRDFLQKSLSQKWRLRQIDNLLSLGKGVYILKNLSQESFNLIQSRRPWTIGGYFIGLRTWEPGLKNSDKLFTKVPVWIELPDLPVEFHANEPLRAIGNHLGSFIRMDTSELQRNNLRFARLLVEVESDAALPDFIWLGNIRQEIRYKNTPFPHARNTSMRLNASLHPQSKEALKDIRDISPAESNWITPEPPRITRKQQSPGNCVPDSFSLFSIKPPIYQTLSNPTNPTFPPHHLEMHRWFTRPAPLLQTPDSNLPRSVAKSTIFLSEIGAEPSQTEQFRDHLDATITTPCGRPIQDHLRMGRKFKQTPSTRPSPYALRPRGSSPRFIHLSTMVAKRKESRKRRTNRSSRTRVHDRSSPNLPPTKRICNSNIQTPDTGSQRVQQCPPCLGHPKTSEATTNQREHVLDICGKSPHHPGVQPEGKRDVQSPTKLYGECIWGKRPKSVVGNGADPVSP